ncbi:MAG TPA: ImmA/IrrE family metallo-endopeptidase [Thiotrichales bacterium]|nr:ImmA/IrrE family metallo-endopeptidase [Thiotrichales bacterium]
MAVSRDTKVRVCIEPDTLAWAMRRARLEEEKLAGKIRVRPERIREWLEGEACPTYAQARRLASALHMGLPSLLLPPPEIRMPVEDFRRGPRRGTEPSPELLEAIYDALRKRDWWRERKKERLHFVGSGRENDPSEVAHKIDMQLSLGELRRKSRTHEDFIRNISNAAEKLGVLVLRQGYVATNTNRGYDPEEFSGFTVVDRIAPVIFVNSGDHPPRQVFTLAHELAHVWHGEGGVEGGLEEEEPELDVEAWADKVAAELLMPEDTFRAVWPGSIPLDDAEAVARQLKVSKTAVLRRALHLGLLERDEFFKALKRLKERPLPPRPRKGGRGDFWRTFAVRNSPTFVLELKRAAMEGEIDAKDVASLLNLNMRTAWTFLERAEDVYS